MGDTRDNEYTARLERLAGARWKRWLNVQAPYRWNLRRLLGDRRVLDVGCGIGRNLANLGPGSVGVDHNPTSVALCREQGFTAFTVDELADYAGAPFDGLLASHLLEHLPAGEAAPALRSYLRYLAPGARVLLICPQERGFKSDPTHAVFLDRDAMRAVCDEVGLRVVRELSFPLPRWAGKVFTYNEFNTLAEL